MAKLRRARRPGPRALPLLAPAALAALLAAPAARAEWKFTPAVDLRETWTDNVALAAPELAKSQFITEISPGFSVLNNSPRLNLHLSYQMHYFAYADKQANGNNQVQHALAGDVKARLVDDLLFLDGSAMRSQQSISAFGPPLTDNGYASANRTEVNTWRISPYLVHRFGGASGELRYTRDSVDSGNTSGLGHSVGDTLSATLSDSRPTRKIGWGLQYTHQKLDDSRAGASSSDTALASLRYRVASSFSLNATGGYDSYDYKSLGGRTSGANWSTGFSWNPSPRTSVDASVGKRYFGSTYALAAVHRSRRTVWSINYNEAVTSTRSEFLLPATIDTAALLDRMLRPTFPDPIQRQQAVQAYILAAGLPPALADSINYFSNRYVLQKSFQASAAFNGTRSSMVLSAFDTRRAALSAQGSDSALLGDSLSTLNDRTRQVGANATMSYHVSPRSDVNLAASWVDVKSLSTGLTNNNKLLTLTMTRQFQSRLRGALELRRVQSTLSGPGARPVRENAVAATLSMQF